MDIRCKNCFKIFDNEYARCPFCGYSDGEPPKELYHLYPGTELLGRYVIGEVLGFGGFGITYKAWDKKFETILAIKEYYPSGIVNRNPGESEVILFTGKKKDIFENGLVRFLDEAKNMAKFSQNNNIVNVFEYFEDNNTGYIVMEFLEGISLNSYLLKQTQKLPLDEIMTITMSVCSALKELHAIGIIHRDISPDNIFMCSNGKIKLIDFGAARFSLNEEKKMTIILKPGFAPPEQYEKINKQGPWTDIYALGATVYLLLTGTKPDESTNRKIEDKVIPPSKLDPSIPEYISNTIMKAIALDKKNRFSTIDKFEKALLKKSKVTNVSNNSSYSQKNNSKGIGSLIAGIAVLACIVIGLVFIFANKKDNLNPTTLTLWYSYTTDNNNETKEIAFESLIEGFNEEYPEVTINTQGISSAEYASRLSQGFGIGDAPDLFESTFVNSEVLQNCMTSEQMLKNIDTRDYYFLDVIKSNTAYTNKLPVGFNIPIFYMNIELTGQILNSKSIDALIDFSFDDTLNGKIGVNGRYETEYNKLFQGDQNYTKEYITNQSLNKFITHNLPYYFSTTEEYYDVQNNLAGSYNIVAIKNGNVPVQFNNCMSINNSFDDKDNQKAALAFFKYMLEPKGQDTMYIANRLSAIPLNKEAYKEYCKMNKEISDVLKESGVIK